jgi:hypothetical protein
MLERLDWEITKDTTKDTCNLSSRLESIPERWDWEITKDTTLSSILESILERLDLEIRLDI